MPATSTSDQRKFAELELFSGLTAEDLDEIEWLLEPFTAPVGEVLFRQGDTPAGLFCIETGRVGLELEVAGRGAANLPDVLGHQTLGEVALLRGEESQITATVLEPVTGYLLAGPGFNAYRASYRPAAFKIMRGLARNLNAKLSKVLDQEALAAAAWPPAKIMQEITTDLREPGAESEKALRDMGKPAQGFDVRVLEALPIFAAFRAAELEQMLQDVELVEVERGRELFSEGAEAMAAYLVVRGAVESFLARSGVMHKLDLHGPGKVFGHQSLLDRSPRRFSARARENSLLLIFDQQDFDEMFDGGSSVAYKLMDAMCGLVADDLLQSTRRLAWFKSNP